MVWFFFKIKIVKILSIFLYFIIYIRYLFMFIVLLQSYLSDIRSNKEYLKKLSWQLYIQGICGVQVLRHLGTWKALEQLDIRKVLGDYWGFQTLKWEKNQILRGLEDLELDLETQVFQFQLKAYITPFQFRVRASVVT